MPTSAGPVLLVLASCRPITNQVNRLEIQCGPSEAKGLVKVLSAWLSRPTFIKGVHAKSHTWRKKYAALPAADSYDLKQTPIDRFVLPQRVQVTKFSPDGSRLLTIEEKGGDQNLIRIWDRSTLQELQQVPTTAAFTNTLLCTAFQSTRELIMPVDQHRIQRLDIQTGEAQILVDRSDADLIKQRGAIIAFAVSQDGHAWLWDMLWVYWRSSIFRNRKPFIWPDFTISPLFLAKGGVKPLASAMGI